ncbi:MAG: hypothetical protein HWN66_14525 [Candidatus Helarchaeota archaeon]|nr:hypothetical protein [Candidatus Helarchaeota archaeon]
MIHSVFITTPSGTCIFEKHYLERSQINSQLISGFINALGAFAKEALGSGMQSLKLQTGEQLFIYPLKETPIIGIVIADPRDNSRLIRNILLEILSEFSTIFKRQLESTIPPDLIEFQEFRYTVDHILDGKVSSRTNFKMFLGVVIGLLLVGTIVLALVPAIIKFEGLNISEFGLTNITFDNDLDQVELATLQTITLVIIGALMLFNCIIFFLPTTIAAYIAGNKKRGIWTAILLGSSIGILILIGTPFIQEFLYVNAILWYLAFSPLLLFLALVCGYYGGSLKERKKLYPLKEFEGATF